MTRRETMSSVDRSWLLMDRPTNRMVINGVWIFKEPVSYPRFMTTLEERLLAFRRFRQRVVEPTNRLGQACWEDDPHFDIRYHVHHIALPAPGDRDALQKLISRLVSDHLDPAKPLWRFYLIENYQEGSVVLGRLHHCIADGMALVRVFLSLTDPTPEDSWQGRTKTGPQRRGWNPLRPLFKTAAMTANTAMALGNLAFAEGLETLNDPYHLVERAGQGSRLAGQTAAVLGKLALMMADDKTVFKGELGVAKQVAWSDPIPLDDVKFVKNRTGTTVNDVLVAALTGGLRHYMLDHGELSPAQEVRAMVPVNVRALDRPIEMGNQFALVYLSLPVGVEDTLDRLFEVKRRMDKIKQSPEAAITYQIISSLGVIPGEFAGQIIEYFANKATAVLTNVPGPQQKLYLAGSLINKMMFWVPQSGSIGMGLSILSYGGEVTVGVLTDDNLVPDPGRVVQGFLAEFAQLLDLARLPDIIEEQALT